MKLSLSVRVAEAYSNKREMRIPFDELTRIAKGAGYEALCMRASAAGVDDPPERIAAVRAALDAAGLTVSMITGDFAVPENGDAGPGCLRAIGPHLDLAEALGADLIRICMKTEDDIEWAARACDEAAERGRGIRLAHQSHTRSLFETVDGSLDVVRAVGRENFGIIYEPANLALCGEDYGPDALRRLAPHLFNVYLQNQVPEPGGPKPMVTWRLGEVASRIHPLDSGQGIDFRSVFDGLHAIGYDGYVTLHHAFDGDLEPEEAAARSARFLMSFL